MEKRQAVMDSQPSKTDTQMREALRDLFFKASGGITDMANDEVNAAMELFNTELKQREQAIAKAYGGCTNCYGKGYATYEGTYFARRFKWKDPNSLVYCSCDRGKQLENLTGSNPKEGDIA